MKYLDILNVDYQYIALLRKRKACRNYFAAGLVSMAYSEGDFPVTFLKRELK